MGEVALVGITLQVLVDPCGMASSQTGSALSQTARTETSVGVKFAIDARYFELRLIGNLVDCGCAIFSLVLKVMSDGVLGSLVAVP